MAEKPSKRDDLVYPDLSYKIVGVLYDVYNNLGPGLSEETYQRAVAIAFNNAALKYEEQLYTPLLYKGEKVAGNYFDFLVEDIVVVELKKGDHFSRTHIEQIYQYLISKKLKLGILAHFGGNVLHFKRIVNL